MMLPDDFDAEMAQAHLTLHGYYPASVLVSSKVLNGVIANLLVVRNNERWFAENNRAIQTGHVSQIRQSSEVSWGAYTRDQLIELVVAMLSYGELHDDP